MKLGTDTEVETDAVSYRTAVNTHDGDVGAVSLAPETVLVRFQRAWQLTALPTQVWTHVQVWEPEHALQTG